MENDIFTINQQIRVADAIFQAFERCGVKSLNSSTVPSLTAPLSPAFRIAHPLFVDECGYFEFVGIEVEKPDTISLETELPQTIISKKLGIAIYLECEDILEKESLMSRGFECRNSVWMLLEELADKLNLKFPDKPQWSEWNNYPPKCMGDNPGENWLNKWMEQSL